MEPLRTWERNGVITWNPRNGTFIDPNAFDSIRGPIYWVTVRLSLADEMVVIVRRQPALTPSLANKRTYNHYARHFPNRCIQIVLVRRGRTEWDGWAELDRVKAYPTQRSLVPRPETLNLT